MEAHPAQYLPAVYLGSVTEFLPIYLLIDGDRENETGGVTLRAHSGGVQLPGTDRLGVCEAWIRGSRGKDYNRLGLKHTQYTQREGGGLTKVRRTLVTSY